MHFLLFLIELDEARSASLLVASPALFRTFDAFEIVQNIQEIPWNASLAS
jgi:hypothetical protein